MTRLPLSISITAQNEEVNLRRCLQSSADLAAEIIVVDSGSTDHTLEVAREFGARVQHQDWLGHSAQKQVALGLCMQPWVLVLDCDEELSPELRAAIQRFFAEGADQRCDGAWMSRLTWFMGRWIRHGDWYPDRKLRLLRREKSRCAGNAVHDKFEVAGTTLQLQGDLYHYSFTDTCHHLTKHVGYSDKAAALQMAEGRQWSLPAAVFRPCWRFFRAYFLRRGFLDGFPGLWIAVATAFFTFERYSRMFESAAKR